MTTNVVLTNVLYVRTNCKRLISLHLLPRGVAFTDERKYDKSVKGLQDNVAIVLGWLGDYSPLIRSLMMYQWTHTMNQLLLVLGLAFSVLWDQVGG